MANSDQKATIHFAKNEFFVGITPSGHAQTLETDSHRGSAASPMGPRWDISTQIEAPPAGAMVGMAEEKTFTR